MEEEEEEEEMDIEDEMDDPEIINPYEIEEGELPPPPVDSDTSSDSEPQVEAEDENENEAATVGTITRAPYRVQLFSGTTYVGSGSSRKMFERANTEYSTLKKDLVRWIDILVELAWRGGVKLESITSSSRASLVAWWLLEIDGEGRGSGVEVVEWRENKENVLVGKSAEAVQIILTGIDNDIYSTVDACPNACEMWKAIERLKQGESINVQDLETNLFWEFGKFTSLDGESLESYYSRFYKMMNELTRNQYNDIYSTVDACPNACEIWKVIERLKQSESINVQDLETNLFWEFGKFTSLDGESLESYYSRFYKMMNELTRNQCKVTNHQVNVQFLLQLQPEWQRFVTLVKQSQELKHVSYHKLYDILKQHRHEVNEIRAKKIACVANLLALVAQQQQVYHPQTHPTQYNQNSSTITQQAATKNRGKDKEINKLMALISLSFKKIYKPTNNNLRTSSNTSRANQDNSPRIHRDTGYESQRSGNVAGARETVGSSMMQKSRIQCYNCKEYGHVARECQKPKRVKEAAFLVTHRNYLKSSLVAWWLLEIDEEGRGSGVEVVEWRENGENVLAGKSGAFELCRWFEKSEMVFSISDCAKRNKVKFAAATLQCRALTRWNSQVATLGLEVAIGKSRGDMKNMMMEEFYPGEKVQRMEDELRSFKLRDTNIVAYTQRFNELVLLCPKAVPTEKKKVEAVTPLLVKKTLCHNLGVSSKHS
uniref:CCHC-type domain-containing protein n=1 Tax=Tanacetum cinerariifolium TaxID=118510 RepID=A0A6L2MLX0_TANCI|nr:hypothetical protein [Tanacetum cinerariifolium]